MHASPEDRIKQLEDQLHTYELRMKEAEWYAKLFHACMDMKLVKSDPGNVHVWVPEIIESIRRLIHVNQSVDKFLSGLTHGVVALNKDETHPIVPLYAVQTPNGDIITNSITETKEMSWHRAFETVAKMLGESWRNEFYYKEAESIKDAALRGFLIIPVGIHPAYKERDE